MNINYPYFFVHTIADTSELSFARDLPKRITVTDLKHEIDYLKSENSDLKRWVEWYQKNLNNISTYNTNPILRENFESREIIRQLERELEDESLENQKKIQELQYKVKAQEERISELMAENESFKEKSIKEIDLFELNTQLEKAMDIEKAKSHEFEKSLQESILSSTHAKNELHSKTIECDYLRDEILQLKTKQDVYIDKNIKLEQEIKSYQEELHRCKDNHTKQSIELQQYKDANLYLVAKKQKYKEKAIRLQSLLEEYHVPAAIQFRLYQEEMESLHWMISSYHRELENANIQNMDLKARLWQSQQENKELLQKQFQTFNRSVDVH